MLALVRPWQPAVIVTPLAALPGILTVAQSDSCGAAHSRPSTPSIAVICGRKYNRPLVCIPECSCQGGSRSAEAIRVSFQSHRQAAVGGYGGRVLGEPRYGG